MIFPKMKFVFAFVLCFGQAQQTFAKVFSNEKIAVVEKRAQDIKNILLDYENMCDKNCRYKLSSVEEIRILEVKDHKTFYTWQSIKDLKTIKTYHIISVEENDDLSEITIESHFPERAVRSQLQGQYKLSHDSIFTYTDVIWNIKEIYDSSNNFLHSKVSYHIKMASSSSWASLFAGKINAGIIRSTNESFAMMTR